MSQFISQEAKQAVLELRNIEEAVINEFYQGFRPVDDSEFRDRVRDTVALYIR